jgi:GxxExxY protein
MPVSISHPLKRLDQEAFRELDYVVMKHAFASQNELGRLCDESIYQRDLSIRLEESGLNARVEFPIRVTHQGFAKVYAADLVVANSAIYELKTTNSLIGEHRRQLLNYLFLTDQPRGKLVNFRSPGVESEFVNASLNLAERRELTSDDARWREVCDGCSQLRKIVNALLADWGAFLDTALYLEAIAHFLGGEAATVARIPLSRRGQLLGSQPVHLLSPDVALRMTAFTEEYEPYEAHVRRFLQHTSLKAIQWINMKHHVIQWITITR